MSSLIKRTEDKIALWELIRESDGELTPVLDSWLEEISKNITSKVDSYKFYLDEFDSEIERLKKDGKDSYAAAKTVENIQDRMKEKIKLAMQMLETNSLNGERYRFSISPSMPRLVIEESVLPKEYVMHVYTVVPDKVRIKSDLDAGITIPGVQLLPGVTLKSYINKGDRK